MVLIKISVVWELPPGRFTRDASGAAGHVGVGLGKWRWLRWSENSDAFWGAGKVSEPAGVERMCLGGGGTGALGAVPTFPCLNSLRQAGAAVWVYVFLTHVAAVRQSGSCEMACRLGGQVGPLPDPSSGAMICC